MEYNSRDSYWDLGSVMISVVISSCLNKPERFDYLKRTVESIVENIPFAEILIGFDKNVCIEIDGIISHCHNKGLGHSWNWGIKEASYDYVLQMEDDWEIVFSEKCKNKKELCYHIEKRIDILENLGGIYKFDFPPPIRRNIWHAGFTKVNNFNYLFFEQKRSLKISDWWKDPQIYLYTNRPHLKNKKVYKEMGEYEENVLPPVVEVFACKKFFEARGKAFFSDFDLFKHIGDVKSRE